KRSVFSTRMVFWRSTPCSRPISTRETLGTGARCPCCGCQTKASALSRSSGDGGRGASRSSASAMRVSNASSIGDHPGKSLTSGGRKVWSRPNHRNPGCLRERIAPMLISPAYAQDISGMLGGATQFLPLVLIFGVFYFLLIRPQQQRAKEMKSMLAALKRGDRVVTGGGILGTVQRVAPDKDGKPSSEV